MASPDRQMPMGRSGEQRYRSSQDPSHQSLIPQLTTLGLHGSRLSRQFQKAIEQLRDIQEERRRLERRHLNEAAELLIRHQRKGLPWDPEGFSSESGFVFSKEQIERHAERLIENATGPGPDKCSRQSSAAAKMLPPLAI
jgi:hypothetical protein